MMPRTRRRAFVVRLARQSLAEFMEDRCSQFAASISYHVLFSLFPLVIVFAGASSLVLNATGSRADVVHTIISNLPLSVAGRADLRTLLLGATSSTAGLGLLGVIGLLYSASGMMASLRMALNQAWEVEDPRPFLKGKLVDFGLVLVVATLGVASFGLTIAARFVTNDAGIPGWAGWMASIAVPLAVAFLVVLFLYRVVPAADVRVADAWPAALLVAGLLVVAQNLFALYVGNFAHYNAVYGSLGAVVAFMFFVYLISTIFLLGAEVASEWPRVRRDLEQHPPSDAGRAISEQIRDTVRGLWVRPGNRSIRAQRRSEDGRARGEGPRDARP